MRALAIFSIGALLLLSIGSSVAQAEQPARHSNARKYRDRSPAATGRAGSAQITARMLYGKNGTTDVEVTTGEFDSAAVPPGSLNKVHLTAFDSLGETMFSRIFNGLTGGGYWTTSFTDFRPGQPFEVKAHVRTDAKRNDQVTITATVQKRPDLLVHTIGVPARVPANSRVQVTAAITELNGQVGARTDCILLVNDEEADRAAGIWVDSGDSVSCAFSHVFPAAMMARIKVAADSVRPGDWDPANNAAETTIEVVTPTPAFDVVVAEGVVYDLDRVGYREYGRYFTSTSTGYDWIYEDLTTAVSDTFQYSAYKGFAPGMPESLFITATDGLTSWSGQRAVTGCESLELGEANGRIFWSYVAGCNGLYVQAGSNAGSVTYSGVNWSRAFQVKSGALVFETPTEYFWNTTTVVAPTRLTGQVWTVEVAVVVDGYTHHSPATFAVSTPFDLGESTKDCFQDVGLAYCTESGWRKTGRVGAFVKTP